LHQLIITFADDKPMQIRHSRSSRSNSGGRYAAISVHHALDITLNSPKGKAILTLSAGNLLHSGNKFCNVSLNGRTALQIPDIYTSSDRTVNCSIDCFAKLSNDVSPALICAAQISVVKEDGPHLRNIER